MGNINLEIVRKMANGELPSPYVVDPKTDVYCVVKVSGAGIIERIENNKKTLYIRDYREYIASEFLNNCIGLPTTLHHPKEDGKFVDLNDENINKYKTGECVYAFERDGRPYAITQTFDPETNLQILEGNIWSVSPDVTHESTVIKEGMILETLKKIVALGFATVGKWDSVEKEFGIEFTNKEIFENKMKNIGVKAMEDKKPTPPQNDAGAATPARDENPEAVAKLADAATDKLIQSTTGVDPDKAKRDEEDRKKAFDEAVQKEVEKKLEDEKKARDEKAKKDEEEKSKKEKEFNEAELPDDNQRDEYIEIINDIYSRRDEALPLIKARPAVFSKPSHQFYGSALADLKSEMSKDELIMQEALTGAWKNTKNLQGEEMLKARDEAYNVLTTFQKSVINRIQKATAEKFKNAPSLDSKGVFKHKVSKQRDALTDQVVYVHENAAEYDNHIAKLQLVNSPYARPQGAK